MRALASRVDLAAAGALAVAFAVYVAAILLERWGVLSFHRAGDILEYEHAARSFAHGSIPYRTVYFEYPPGALPPMLVVEPAANYPRAFKIEMAVLGAMLLPFAAVVLRSQKRRLLPALLAIAISPVAVGSVFVNRYDVFPALVLLAAIAALVVWDRPTLALVLIALAAVSKVYPAVALLPAVVWIWRTKGRDALERGLRAVVATVVVVMLPFAVLGPGGLGFSVYIQLTRHLQTESLGASLLLAADRLGLYSANVHNGSPGSLDVFGFLPSVVASLSLVVVVAGLVWVTWQLWSGPVDSERVVVAVVAAVAVYVAFGKVLSPQYLIWLVPLVPLVGRRVGAVATALLLPVLVMTQIEFDYGYHNLERIGPVVWLILARNVLLVVITVLLLRALRVRPSRQLLASCRFWVRNARAIPAALRGLPPRA